MQIYTGIEELLLLDGMIIAQENGCWVKIEAKTTKSITKERPHGIRYSLTLHSKNGERILGYDNSHPVKEKKRRHTTIKHVAYDHKHNNKEDKGAAYHFSSPQKLLTDFWFEVDKRIKNMER